MNKIKAQIKEEEFQFEILMWKMEDDLKNKPSIGENGSKFVKYLERNISFKLARNDRRNAVISTSVYMDKIVIIYKFIALTKNK